MIVSHLKKKKNLPEYNPTCIFLMSITQCFEFLSLYKAFFKTGVFFYGCKQLKLL